MRHMADTLREVTIGRGYDPRDFVLFAYGGAGPAHCAGFGAELGVRTHHRSRDQHGAIRPMERSPPTSINPAELSLLHARRRRWCAILWDGLDAAINCRDLRRPREAVPGAHREAGIAAAEAEIDPHRRHALPPPDP